MARYWQGKIEVIGEKSFPLSLFDHKSLTECAGIEHGPVGVGFVIDKVTFELHVTCITVGQMKEFDISLEIYIYFFN
jgi:hypothetical protein